MNLGVITPTRLTLCTAGTPGAVAILQLHGPGVCEVLAGLTGRLDWPERRAVLCDFAGIDEGLALVLGPEVAQLMPHGGPRVVQNMVSHLVEALGCVYDPAPDPVALYPEAATPIEADMLHTLGHAPSPAAIDLLAAQPGAWRVLSHLPEAEQARAYSACAAHSARLDRLIHPPAVAVIGPPNAGKSTLTNALLGRSVSIVADLPGTTRDWVGTLVELAPVDRPDQAVAVYWLDTPGLRTSGDVVEQRAIGLARQKVEQAEVLIAMRGPEQAWPAAEAMPRSPDLWVVNKVDEAADDQPDEAGATPSLPLQISAAHHRALGLLQSRVLRCLGLDELAGDEVWAFSPVLKRYIQTGAASGAGEVPVGLACYLGA